jgi:hypothetical protein
MPNNNKRHVLGCAKLGSLAQLSLVLFIGKKADIPALSVVSRIWPSVYS